MRAAGLEPKGEAWQRAKAGEPIEQIAASGDQVVFLKNDTALGVKNGMLGKVADFYEEEVDEAVAAVKIQLTGDEIKYLEEPYVPRPVRGYS